MTSEFSSGKAPMVSFNCMSSSESVFGEQVFRSMPIVIDKGLLLGLIVEDLEEEWVKAVVVAVAGAPVFEEECKGLGEKKRLSRLLLSSFEDLVLVGTSGRSPSSISAL